MGKKGRRGNSKDGSVKKKGRQGPAPEYASDDERLYGDFEEPDPKSRSYIYDEVDEFHAGREKILLDEGHKQPEAEEQSDEEILGLDAEDSDDEEIRNIKAQLRRIQRVHGKDAIASDIEDQDEEEEDNEKGLPDSRAWGVKRNKYYGDDDVELKNLENEEAAAVMEEKEALKLQRQMADLLDDQDFGLELFKQSEPEKVVVDQEEQEEKIVKDLSKLTKRDKLKLLKKESPELITLIDDFKVRMTEVQDKLCPLKELIEKESVTGKAADYIHTKFKLNLNYSINILFYLMLKAKQAPVHNHPVIKRLLQYRGIMKQLEPVDEQIQEELEDILTRLKRGEDVSLKPKVEAPRTFVRRKVDKNRKSSTQQKPGKLAAPAEGEDSDDLYEDFGGPSKAKKKPTAPLETEAERAALDFYDMMKAKGRAGSDESEQEESDGGDNKDTDNAGAVAMDMEYEEWETDEKRAITYQIEKNKGLIARKKKELRNPRVKHRMKYRKANIRRTGQFRTPRTEMQKYAGEISGIRLGVKRGVKLN